jgi:MFS family permease
MSRNLADAGGAGVDTVDDHESVVAPPPLTVNGVPSDPNLRVLALATLVNTVGNGALTTTFALYFTHVVGLRATQVGMALSAAALVGLLVQVPMGHLGDIRGPRELLRFLMIGAGVTSLGLLLTDDVWLLVLVLAVQAVFDRGGSAVRSGLIARLAQGSEAVRFKAYLRAVTNVGISFGALLGGLALWAGRPWAYLTVFALNAVSFVLAALVVGRLPHIEPAPARAEGQPRLQVLRDLPFVLVTILTGIFAIHFFVMELAVPLWLATRTSAPKWLVAVVLLINTVAVALFQVRLSRGSGSVLPAARTLLVGAGWIAGGFALIAFASDQPRWLAVVLVCGGAAVHVVGEMIGSGGQWGVQMGLAPRERQGQYQGLAGMSFSLSAIAAPPLVTFLCIEWGRPGWFVLGGVILAAGALSIPASAWALRTRERYGVLTHSG